MIYVGIDPGKGGAVAFINDNDVQVFDTPLKKNTKTGKSEYDINAMADLFRQYISKDVCVIIEAVFSRPGQGVSSVFDFGRGKGIWEGIVIALGFDLNMVTPQTWKKVSFPELIVSLDIKDKKPKLEKDKKELAKLRRDAKVNAKAKAREIAGKLFPSLVDRFKTVNSDGRAEALLIAVHAKNHFKTL